MAILRVVGDSLCQWDTGRKVLISVPANTDIKRVDFKSRAVEEMMGMKTFVEEGRLVSEIPNIMLQYPEEITAYVVMRHSGDEERTILINTFEVEPKDKPPGYVCEQQEVLRFESLEERIAALEKGSPVGPSGGGVAARIGYITLLSDKWKGDGHLYSQIVSVEGATKNSQVDLTPSVEQLAIFYEKDLAFVTENEDGVVTVYAIGQKPQNDYTIQVTITEVAYE